MMPTTIEIVEVGPRDGLQDEPGIVSTEDKIAYIQGTVRAGIARVEVASFVNPKRVPQMADAEAVIAGLTGTELRPIGLVLNERGLDRALAAGIGEINAVVVVTDTFSRENQGMSTADAIAMWERVAGRARQAGVRAGVTLSAAFGCPFEGEVPAARVVEIAKTVADAGADEIALADTIGAAVPNQTEDLVAAVAEATGVPMRVHLHNSRNTGLANAVAAIRGGATTLDASTGGLGGCPFAPGATGNIATEDLVHMLEHMGVSTGVQVDALLETVAFVERIVGHPVPGMLSKAGVFPRRMPL
ncbi:MAG TPA: hydroxymethylglutaryl-CoA lyase [Ilumatobacteraceae bacterium]|nr:hydroxymethylglutaryl-CoA lyase [Ilumatobacteraceae bacterium]